MSLPSDKIELKVTFSLKNDIANAIARHSKLSESQIVEVLHRNPKLKERVLKEVGLILEGLGKETLKDYLQFEELAQKVDKAYLKPELNAVPSKPTKKMKP